MRVQLVYVQSARSSPFNISSGSICRESKWRESSLISSSASSLTRLKSATFTDGLAVRSEKDEARLTLEDREVDGARMPKASIDFGRERAGEKRSSAWSDGGAYNIHSVTQAYSDERTGTYSI